MKLSIVILTWNERTALQECLDSLRQAALPEDHEIIVVDNGSTDGTMELLREKYPWVRGIANPTNRGVAAGRNQGLHAASGEYLLLADNDTSFQRQSVATMLEEMESRPRVGLLGPKLLNPDGSVQASCRRFPSIAIPLISRVRCLRRVGPFRRMLDRHLMRDFDHDTPAEVDYVLGACQLLRRQAYEQAGPFDERIFFGPDDCDYALRVWQKGWNVEYAPRARVVHRHRRRTRRFGRMMLRHVGAMAWYFWKHRYLFRPPVRAGGEPGRS